MEILGIGPLELVFILLIALIILGPKDMAKAGRTLGRFLRKVVTSQEWHTVQRASRELRNLPTRLMREASLEDLNKELSDINKIGGDVANDIKKIDLDFSSWTTPPSPSNGEVNKTEVVDPPPSESLSPASPDNPPPQV